MFDPDPWYGDFRSEGMKESERLLAEWRRETAGSAGTARGQVPDPLASGLSYCIAAEGGAEALARARRRSFTAAVLSLTALVMSAVLLAVFLWLGGYKGGLPSVWKVFPAAGAFAAATLLFAKAGRTGRRAAERSAADRLGEAVESLRERSRYVVIEDPRTRKKMKTIGEDAVMMVVHDEERCVQLEGIGCRYLIHAADVNAIEDERSGLTPAVTLRYRIGSVELAMTLTVGDPRDAAEAASRRGRNVLFERIVGALSCGEPARALAADEGERAGWEG